jgi:hypothetical protein
MFEHILSVHVIPAANPALGAFLIFLILLAALLNLSAWRSPRAPGGHIADNARALATAGWTMLGIWYVVRFVSNDFDLRISSITAVALAFLALKDIMCAVHSMNRARMRGDLRKAQREATLV